MIFSIIGGCVENRTGVLLDFPRFPSSIIMTRETPAVVVSRTVFEGEKGVERYGLANTRSDLFEFERHFFDSFLRTTLFSSI